MRKLFTVMLVVLWTMTAFAGAFQDVPREHWAYQALESLASKGIIEGFADGTFKGSKNLTRYEAAKVVAKLAAISGDKGLDASVQGQIEKLLNEFSHELSLIGVRVSALQENLKDLHGSVAKLKESTHVKGKVGESWFGKMKLTAILRHNFWNLQHQNDTLSTPVANTKSGLGINVNRENDFEDYTFLYNYFHIDVDEDISGFAMFLTAGLWGENENFEHIPMNKMYAQSWNRELGDSTPVFYYGYVDIKNLFNKDFDLRAGRQAIKIGHSIAFCGPVDAVVTTKKMDRFTMKSMMWDGNLRDSMNDNLFTPAMIGSANTTGLYHTLGANNRNEDNTLENGFSSMAMTLDTKYKDHNIGLYYLQQSYDNYDPYAKQGDVYAVKYANGASAAVSNAMNDTLNAPSADPSWLGLTLDGTLTEKLAYYFEFIRYDSDLSAYRGDEIAGALAVEPNFTINGNTFAIDFQNNNLDIGYAWMLGLDYDINDDWTLLLQYGEGNEEFAPSLIKTNWRFNDMYGRFNAQASRELFWSQSPSGSFQGVKDLFAKLTWDVNEKSKIHFRYERCKENDTSSWRNVATTNGSIYGVANANANYIKPTDYVATGLGLKHNITKNCNFLLEYIAVDYDQDAWWHDADNDGVRDAGEEYDMNLAPNAGGWEAIRLITEVKF